MKKQFDVFDLEQLVTLLENRFSSINIPVDYGICVSFICPEVYLVAKRRNRQE